MVQTQKEVKEKMTMEIRKNWILEFITKGRKYFKKPKNQDNLGIFPEFKNDNPYLKIEEWNIEDSGKNHVELRIFQGNFLDEILLDKNFSYIYAEGLDPQYNGMWVNQNEYNYTYAEFITNDGELEEVIFNYPLTELKLPPNYYETNPQILLHKYLKERISEYQNSLYQNIQVRTVINRLSSIWPEDLTKIVKFLSPSCDWKGITDDEKSKLFHLIFYYLGFDFISLEILIHHPKFSSKIGSKPHPDFIIYSHTNNEIYIVEEMDKLGNKDLYKKDTQEYIIKLFSDFFPKKTNRYYFYYLIKKKSSGLPKIHIPTIDQTEFKEKLSTIFNNELLSKDLFKKKWGKVLIFEEDFRKLIKSIFPT